MLLYFFIKKEQRILLKEVKTMENKKEKSYRVVVVLTAEEKEKLQALARNDLRSMSGVLRYLLYQEVNKDFFEE